MILDFNSDMNLLKQQFFVLLVMVVGVVGPLAAHNPGEISYVFQQKTKTLTIHCTTKSIIDLLQHLDPETKKLSTIKLENYQEEYVDYFNDNIELCINGERVELVIVNSNLDRHDATLEFNLLGDPKTWEEVEITVNSFTEIYRKPYNFVKFELDHGTQKFLFNKNSKKVSFLINNSLSGL